MNNIKVTIKSGYYKNTSGKIVLFNKATKQLLIKLDLSKYDYVTAWIDLNNIEVIRSTQ